MRGLSVLLLAVLAGPALALPQMVELLGQDRNAAFGLDSGG